MERSRPKLDVPKCLAAELVESERHRFVQPELPFALRSAEFAQMLHDMIERGTPVGIVEGETGSGKTTLAPQIAEMSNLFPGTIYVSEPKIILARETRKRIVMEMSERLGYDASTLVGYGTSPESVLHPNNRIIIGTHGYISQRIHHTDPDDLKGSLLLADEYHDREVEGDVVVEMAKKFGIPTVLLSATIDTDALSNFHSSHDGVTPAPVLSIEGRSYPIENHQMKDSTQAVAWAIDRGLSVLYFLPGKYEIETEPHMIHRFTKKPFVPLPLHSELSANEQSRVFEKYKHPKVILATNIAESGMTPDVDVVVDTRIKKTSILRAGVDTLTLQPVSLASSKQRAGRCGRTGPGIYIQAPHSGSPKEIIIMEHPAYTPPEIYNKRPDSVTLRLGQTGLNLYTLGLKDRPDDKEIDRSNNRLAFLGAMTIDHVITETGLEMARLPLDPDLARMVVKSREFGKTVNLFMIAGAVVSQIGGVGMREKDKERWRKLTKESRAQMLLELDVYVKALDFNEHKRRHFNILDQKFQRATRQIIAIAKREGLDISHLTKIPNEDERQQLLECMTFGIEDIFINHGTGELRDTRREQKRRLPKRLVINSSRLVAGKAWNNDTVRNNRMVRRNLIVRAMATDVETLVRTVPNRCSFVNQDYAIDDKGIIIARKRVLFDGISTGEDIITPMHERTPELREFIIDALFQEVLLNDNALPQLMQDFRSEVSQLRDIEHRSIVPIGVDALLDEIQIEIHKHVPEKAQTIKSVLEYIDPNYVHGFMSDQIRNEILAISPDTIAVQGIDGRQFNISVHYINHKAEITVIDYNDIRNLPSFIPELDGRFVTVRVEGSSKVESYQAVTSGKYKDSRDVRRGIDPIVRIDRINPKKIMPQPTFVKPSNLLRRQAARRR